MSLSTNLLMLLLGINLMLFVFGNPENNSPMLGIIKAIFLSTTGGSDWSYLIFTIGKNMWIFGTLVLIIAGVSYLTGSTPLTGGGYASVLSLQILAISILSSLILMPNFATFGFPAMIEYVLDIIFGGWITATVITVLKGM